MLANETRGETSIKLEGIEYVMRPSYEAIDQFEQSTGKSAKELFDAAAADKLRLADLAAVVGACVRAKGRQEGDGAVSNFRDGRIKELLPSEEGGILVATRRVAIVLLMAVTGGVTSMGEPKPLPTTTSPSTEESEGSLA